MVEVSNLHRTEAFVSHRNARLTVHGRRLLVERVRLGRPVARVAAEMGISRPTAHKWIRHWRSEGEPGLADRSSRPRTTPHRTAATVETRVCRLRQDRKLGPARIGPILGLPASTVHRILTRHGLNRLAHLDRPTDQPIRRYERARPGELIHVDVKKLGRIPDGGGHKVLGRQAGRAHRNNMGFDYIHSAVDDHTRLAYSEIHDDEKAATCADFLRRAAAFFTTCGITCIERVLTDNAWPYRKSSPCRFPCGHTPRRRSQRPPRSGTGRPAGVGQQVHHGAETASPQRSGTREDYPMDGNLTGCPAGRRRRELGLLQPVNATSCRSTSCAARTGTTLPSHARSRDVAARRVRTSRSAQPSARRYFRTARVRKITTITIE